MRTTNIPWNHVRYRVVDLEGNGFQPPDIVELAIVTLEQGSIIGSPAVWLLKPEQPITRFATKVHQITNKDVVNAPTFDAVQTEVRQQLQDDYIIAHNAPIDYKVLNRKLPEWQPKGVLDTLKLAKTVLPRLESYSLGNLTKQLSLSLPDTAPDNLGPHRAGYDALLTAQLFLYLLTHSNSKISTLSDLVSVAQIKQATESSKQQKLF